MLALALSAAAIAAVFTQLQPARYQSDVTLVVQTSAGANDTETLIRTMIALVDSEVIGEELRARMDDPLPVDTITDNLAVERPPGSSVMTISYTDTDSDRSVSTAQEFVPVFQEQVQLLEVSQAGQLAPNYAVQPWGNGAVITSEVAAPVLRNAAIAALLGALLGGVGALLHQQRNPLIRTASDAETATGLPVITASTALVGTRSRRSQWNPGDVMDAVLNRLPEALGERVLPQRVLVVSTAGSGPRAAFVTHLARSLQDRDEPVTVIDADLERGSLSRELRLTGRQGLADVLRDGADASSLLVVPDRGLGSGLSVLPAGSGLPLRARSAVTEVGRLGGRSRVVVDSPGVSAHQSLGALLRAVDAVIILAVAGSADASETVSLSSLIRSLGSAPAAVVLLSSRAVRPQLVEPHPLPRLAPRTAPSTSLSS